MRKTPPNLSLLTIAVIIFCSTSNGKCSPEPSGTALRASFYAKTFDEFVAAIHLHESDGRFGRIYGDGGRSYGPLQISYRAWHDAVRAEPSIGGKYQDCRFLEYSKKVMLAYLRHYDRAALESGDWETCARLWNSGPAWRTKIRRTDEYWAAVRTYLLPVNS